VLFTVIISAPVGWVQVRTGGLAFALLTVAFGMMFYTVAWKWYNLTGGDDGLMGVPQPDITFFGLKIVSSGDSMGIYYFTLIVVLGLFLLTWRVVHSPLGAVLEAIRENEERASFVGINVRAYKLIGWMMACGLAGVAGSIYILYRGYTGPGVMAAFAGAGVLMMVLLGGMGSLWGPLLGAAIFIFMKDYISTMTEHWEFFVGLVVILLVLVHAGRLWLVSTAYLTKPRGE
jgi:branched-chain amino acid transport system permease protein